MKINRGKLRLRVNEERERENLLALARAIDNAEEGKKEREWNNGLFSVCGAYVPYDDPVVSGDLLAAENPEEIFLERERSETLEKKRGAMSEEARQILDMILTAPESFYNILSVKTSMGAKPEKVVKMLGRRWKDKRYAKAVVSELREFVRAF